jgi:hypothetical protein
MNFSDRLLFAFVCLAAFAQGKDSKDSYDYSGSTVYSEKDWLDPGCPDFSYARFSAQTEEFRSTESPSYGSKSVQLNGRYFSDCSPTRATLTTFSLFNDSDEVVELLAINAFDNATFQIVDKLLAETSTCVVKNFSDYECNCPPSVLVPFSFQFFMVADAGKRTIFKLKRTSHLWTSLNKEYNVNRCKKEASASFDLKVGNVTVETENDVTLGRICTYRRGLSRVFNSL